MHEHTRCHDEAANHQLPIAVAFWIIWIVSMEESGEALQDYSLDVLGELLARKILM